MNGAKMILAAPEFWVLAMACVIMVVDLFLREERRGIIHVLAMLTVIFASIITLRGDYMVDGVRSVTAFSDSFIRDPMGDVLKVFSCVIMGLIFIYSKFYLRSFKMFRADFFTLSLFALLGVMLLISANSMLMIYLGLELISVVERGAKGLAARDLPGIDITKRLGRVSLDGVKIGRDAVLPKGNAAAIRHLFDAGALAVTAEAVGAAEAALALTTRYAKQRIQFGRPIGTFQAVKHPLAEAYVDTQSFQSLVYYAVWCIDHGHRDLPLAVSRAKAYASEALPKLGIDTVQLHGGIGYTWEYDAHLFPKRAKWMRRAFGDADWHYERAAQLGGL